MRFILVDPNKEDWAVVRWQFRDFPEVQLRAGGLNPCLFSIAS